MQAMKTPIGLALMMLCSCGPLISTQAELLGVGDVTDPATAAAAVDAGTPAVDPGADGGGIKVEVDGGLVLTGLPCDVRAVLVAQCSQCHSGQSYTARALLSREDFLSASAAKAGAGLTVGEYAAKRMSPGAPLPMPPYGYNTQPTAAQKATLLSWVDAGMPAGACASLPPK